MTLSVRWYFCSQARRTPLDQPGQDQLRRVHEVSQTPECFGKFLLVEGYDLSLARRLLGGVDVWLNTAAFANTLNAASFAPSQSLARFRKRAARELKSLLQRGCGLIHCRTRRVPFLNKAVEFIIGC